MEKQNKMKLIVILAVTIILGIFVAGVTAQTISQNRQQYDSSQNVGTTTSDSSQGCCEWKNPSCCNGGASRGCC
jgi:hypothetical protein